MNVSLPTVKRLLARLQQENIVVREGNNRKGKWVIQKRSVTRNEYYPTRSNYGEKLNYEKADQRNIEYGMEI